MTNYKLIEKTCSDCKFLNDDYAWECNKCDEDFNMWQAFKVKSKSNLEKEQQCDAIYKKIKEANTPDE